MIFCVEICEKCAKFEEKILVTLRKELGWGEQQRGRLQRPITVRRTTSKALSSSKPDAAT